jgi:hypothetical protein
MRAVVPPIKFMCTARRGSQEQSTHAFPYFHESAAILDSIVAQFDVDCMFVVASFQIFETIKDRSSMYLFNLFMILGAAR